MLENIFITKNNKRLEVANLLDDIDTQHLQTLVCYIILQLQELPLPSYGAKSIVTTDIECTTEIEELKHKIEKLNAEIEKLKENSRNFEKDRLLLSSAKDYYSTSIAQLENTFEQRLKIFEKLDEKYNSGKKHQELDDKNKTLEERIQRIEELIKKKSTSGTEKRVTIAPSVSRNRSVSSASSLTRK